MNTQQTATADPRVAQNKPSVGFLSDMSPVKGFCDHAFEKRDSKFDCSFYNIVPADKRR